MSALVLDAGALIAIDRGDRAVLARIVKADKVGDPVRTNAMAIAQVWRDGKGRQARLARILRGVEVEPSWRCSQGPVTAFSPAIPTTCGDCATRPAATPW